jgi:hypothetical protein
MQCTGGSPATKRERSQWPHLCAVGRQILTGRQVQLAERGGFEPPIGLHLCRISSAVQSTTLPPLQAQIRANQALRSGRVLERFDAKWKPVRVKKTRQNRRGEPGSDSMRTDRLYTRKPGQTTRPSPPAGSRHQRDAFARGWDRQTRKKPAVPCRVIEIAGQEVRLRGPA